MRKSVSCHSLAQIPLIRIVQIAWTVMTLVDFSHALMPVMQGFAVRFGLVHVNTDLTFTAGNLRDASHTHGSGARASHLRPRTHGPEQLSRVDTLFVARRVAGLRGSGNGGPIASQIQSLLYQPASVMNAARKRQAYCDTRDLFYRVEYANNEEYERWALRVQAL